MGLLLFLLFIVFIVIGIPIAFSTGMVALLPTLVAENFPANGEYFISTIVSGANNLTIIAIPLFVLAGTIMTKGGISEKIFQVFAYFLGKLPGGIPSSVIITCLFFGAISGSGPATCAAVGSMTLPILLKLGYDKKFSAAIIVTAAGLGIIIPPSVPYVMYGLATGTSVGDMFLAGILPGLLLGLTLILFAVSYCVIKGENKAAIQEMTNELRNRKFLPVFFDSLWALLAPVIILGGIYSGLCTPTEASVISVFYAIIISVFVYKKINFKNILDCVLESIKICAPLCFILAIATPLGRILALMNVPAQISTFVTTYAQNPTLFMFIMCLIVFIMGMFMDCAPALTIIAPLVLPAAKLIGIHPVHLGIVLCIGMAIGFVSPPFGLNLYVLSPMLDETPMDIARRSLPALLVFIVTWLIIAFVPSISLCLLK